MKEENSSDKDKRVRKLIILMAPPKSGVEHYAKRYTTEIVGGMRFIDQSIGNFSDQEVIQQINETFADECFHTVMVNPKSNDPHKIEWGFAKTLKEKTDHDQLVCFRFDIPWEEYFAGIPEIKNINNSRVKSQHWINHQRFTNSANVVKSEGGIFDVIVPVTSIGGEDIDKIIEARESARV